MTRIFTPHLVLLAIVFGVVPLSAAPAHWNFDSKEAPGLSLRGKASAVEGVVGKAQSLDGRSLVAVSKDYGRTWTRTGISNLPMATSKPAAGVHSTGQRYLVRTTATNNGGKRTPLTIAVSRPGENVFSKVHVIRRSQNPDHPGESADHLNLSYPCAIEHEGKLYVGYSNNGGRKGNLNSAELAVIPIKALEVAQ